MHRLIVLVLLAVSVLVVPAVVASRVQACSCMEPWDNRSLSGSTVVFAGAVTGYEEIGDPLRPGDGAAVWTFAVDRVFKGTVQATVLVKSSIGGASCGLEIPRQGSALVFASERPDPLSAAPDEDVTLWAGLCGGTRSLDGVAVPALLGTGAVLTPGQTASAIPPGEISGAARRVPMGPPLAVTVTAVLVVGAGLVIRRRRRRER